MQKEQIYKHRVFITGDTHCPIDIHKLNSKNYPLGNTLTKSDVLIICGDGGFVWSDDKRDKWWIEWISNKPWTTVYIDGNHENHPLLNSYPVVDFYGAKANKITDSLYHIKRGEIMTINGKTFFCIGGAFSHDVEFRTENVDWWQEELPNKEEIKNAVDNLTKYNNKVNYIVTHDIPLSLNKLFGYDRRPNMNRYDTSYLVDICEFLQKVYDTVKFNQWFAGHYHVDTKLERITILYNDIIELDFDDGSFNKIKTPIEDILNRTYNIDQLFEISMEENLYIDTKLNINTFDALYDEAEVMPLVELLKCGLTEDEVNTISRKYNEYCLTKIYRDQY